MAFGVSFGSRAAAHAWFARMRVSELRAVGMTEADANAEALRRFGNTDEFRSYSNRRATRKARWHGLLEWFAAWAQDIRFANRQFRRAPGFTAVAVLTMALGIGANTAIFTVVHHLVLAPLPYPNGNRIVMPRQENARGFRLPVDAALVKAWQARGHAIEMIAGATAGGVPIRPDGTPDTISYMRITSNFLQVFGAGPALGRTFTASEELPGAAPVAMISYGWWQQAAGGRTDILGTNVRVNAKWYSVVGVMPPGMAIPMYGDRAPDIWLPASLDETSAGSGLAFAKLRPGASSDAATRELETIAPSVPDGGKLRGRLRAMRAQDFLDAREARTIQVLFVAVGGLLLIACANVANLLLARAWTRRREFAVRVALGAGRARLTRQVLTESVILALAGGALGIVVAWQVLKIIIALRPPSLDDLAGVYIEPPVMLWSLAVSVATGILFGCAPAFSAGARLRGLGDALRSETRAGSGGVAIRRVRSSLIIVEIAMSLVLLVSAGLLVRSFRALQHIPLGFEPRGLVMVTAFLPPTRPLTDSRPQDDAVPTVRAAAVEGLKAVPGVIGVAAGIMPGLGFINGSDIETDAGGHLTSIRASAALIGGDYPRVARIALVEGRLPDSSASTPEWQATRGLELSAEVVVNRAVAERLFPGGRAIASRIRMSFDPRSKRIAPWSTVVGVVDDTHMPGVRDDFKLLWVYSLTPPHVSLLSFVVRTTRPGAAATAEIQRAMAAVDRRLVVQPPLAGETYLRASLAPTRFAMALLTAFAIVALVLSTVGLYSVIAYSVSQRTHEIGIRVALGAEPRTVVGLVVGGGLRLAAAGVLVGAVAAAASTRVLATLLYTVTPADPLTFASIALLVASIALVASYMPARRALRIDPTQALRAD